MSQTIESFSFQEGKNNHKLDFLVTMLAGSLATVTPHTIFSQISDNTIEKQQNEQIGWLISHTGSMPAYGSSKIEKICVPEGDDNRKLDCSIPRGVPVEVFEVIGEGDTAVAKIKYTALDAHKKSGQGGFLYVPYIAGEFYEKLDGVDVYKWGSVSPEQFSKNVRGYRGSDYVWGGNLGKEEVGNGFSNVLNKISPHEATNVAKNGVDCSGLYSASMMEGALIDTLDGAKVQENPELLKTLFESGRNTSELLRENENVSIYGKTNKEIAASLRVGDYMVWRGHMMIVVENEKGKLVWAESRYPQGYVETGLVEGLRREKKNPNLKKMFVDREDYDRFYKIYLGQHKTYTAIKDMYKYQKEQFKEGLISKKELHKRERLLGQASKDREKPTIINRTYSD